MGATEVPCEYCSSLLRFVPGEEELEVVRTREEMKHRERVAIQKQILRNRLEQEEMERWRQTAARVAIAAVMTRTASSAGYELGLLAAAGTLTIIPGAIVIWFVRNYIARGFAMGRV